MGNVRCSTALTGVMADRPLELYSGKGAIGAVAEHRDRLAESFQARVFAWMKRGEYCNLVEAGVAGPQVYARS